MFEISLTSLGIVFATLGLGIVSMLILHFLLKTSMNINKAFGCVLVIFFSFSLILSSAICIDYAIKQRQQQLKIILESQNKMPIPFVVPKDSTKLK